MNIEPSIYEKYRPFRNHFRRTKLDETLYVIWSYTQNLQFGSEINNDIEVIAEYKRARHWVEKHIFPWELEIMLKEAILNCSESVGTETFRKWNYFSSGVNKLKALENEVCRVHNTEQNVLLELFRIAHRQFPWQSSFPSPDMLIRYYKIFSEPHIQEMVENYFGLSLKKIYLIGTVIIGFGISKVAVQFPTRINVKGLTEDDLSIFINHYAKDIESLRTQLITDQAVDECYSYRFSPIRALPIIKMSYHGLPSLVFPMPTLLFWRLTSGIYYDICNVTDFDNYFGSSFESYVGEVLAEALSGDFLVLKERSYFVGSNRKNTIDWFVIKDNSCLFIECKTKRMRNAAKVELHNLSDLDEELDKAARFVIQVYKTVLSYRNNEYPKEYPRDIERIYVLVVTLEDWYLWGGFLLDKVKEKVAEKVEEENIPKDIVTKVRYSFCSLDELEHLAQIVNEVGITKYFHYKYYDDEKNEWAHNSYYIDRFQKENSKYKPLFAKEFDELFHSYEES